jgi:hypothetical protein
MRHNSGAWSGTSATVGWTIRGASGRAQSKQNASIGCGNFVMVRRDFQAPVEIVGDFHRSVISTPGRADRPWPFASLHKRGLRASSRLASVTAFVIAGRASCRDARSEATRFGAFACAPTRKSIASNLFRNRHEACASRDTLQCHQRSGAARFRTPAIEKPTGENVRSSRCFFVTFVAFVRTS